MAPEEDSYGEFWNTVGRNPEDFDEHGHSIGRNPEATVSLPPPKTRWHFISAAEWKEEMAISRIPAKGGGTRNPLDDLRNLEKQLKNRRNILEESENDLINREEQLRQREAFLFYREGYIKKRGEGIDNSD